MQWYASIAPVHKEESLHHYLLGEQRDKILSLVRSSFGHRVGRAPRSSFPPHCESALLSIQRWLPGASNTFQEWNIDCHEGAARLRILDQKNVGAILFVGCGETGDPFITVSTAPTIKPVAPNEASNFGAPDWHETFPSRKKVEYEEGASGEYVCPDFLPVTNRDIEFVCPDISPPTNRDIDRTQVLLLARGSVL